MSENNNKKFCFIICTNNTQYLEECLLYLNMLEVPEGYEVELITIEDAQSMTSGYNEAMNASDAKYKIYIHQDTFVTEKKILYKLLKVFKQDNSIGLIGTIGSKKLSKDGVMWHGKRCGNFYRLDMLNKIIGNPIDKIRTDYEEVDVVDGLFIATQYDLPWREDILDGWDFYDVSQCLEFRRVGYKVVIPKQKKAWVNHVCGVPGYWNYNKYREIVLKEYSEIANNSDYLRIYFMLSKEIGVLGIAYELQKMGHEVDISDRSISIHNESELVVEIIEEILEEGHYDLVISYDLILAAAKACNNMGVKYWAWTYDSPLMELYRDEAKYPNVYVSVFDKMQYERIKAEGVKNLFHIPLATEVDYFGKVNITKSDEKKYAADVAFVGRLYDKHGYEEIIATKDEELRLEADKIVNSCGCVWDGETTIYGKASKKLIAHMTSKITDVDWDKYRVDKGFFCESLKLVRKCNEIERVTILNKLAERHNVVLYSDESAKTQLKNVKICPWVDYWEEMPKVFYISKINLNITSRSIESGIPQRVFDIMAVGGFCLTNYQPELEEYFEIGKDLEVFHNLQELEEKVEYYLKHEEARVRIAVNGYKKVRAYHNYQVRMEKIIDVVLKK